MRLLNRVIKASQYDQFSSGLLVEEHHGPSSAATSLVPETSKKNVLDQAFQKAKEIVDSAQALALKQKREAFDEIEKERSQAKKSGYDDGFAQGCEEGKAAGFISGKKSGYEDGLKNSAAENKKNLDELASMIESVEKSKNSLLQNFESGIKDLACEIARSILKSELKTNENAMRAIIKSAMNSYRSQSWVRIYVSNGTAEVLLKGDNNIINELKEISDNIKVIPNPEMDDSDCLLETPEKIIDAGIGPQFEKLKAAVENSAANTQK